VPDALGHERGRVHQRVQIDSCFDSKAVEHVDEVLGGEVALRSWRIWATPETPGRHVECRDPRIERCQDIGERRPARVVEVKRDLSERHLSGDGFDDGRYLSRMSNADRIAHRHFERPHADQGSGDASDRARLDRSFERAAEGSGQVRPHSHPELTCTATDVPIDLQRFADGLVDVLPAERL